MTGILATTLHAYFAVADVTQSGRPKDGYLWGRGGNTTSSLDWFDSNGHTGAAGVGNLPPAMFLDSGQSPVDPPPIAMFWGGQVVTVWNTTNGQAAAGTVFQADGTNTAPGGTWVNPSTFGTGTTGFYGNGADGTATCDGATAVAGMTLSGSDYYLTRDVQFANLTVNNGITVHLGNNLSGVTTQTYSLQVNGTLTFAGTGRLYNSGMKGQDSGAGSAGGTLPSGSFGGGGTGGNGDTGGGSTAGANTTSPTTGNGGAGGNGSATAGSAGGTAANPTANQGSFNRIFQMLTGSVFGGGALTFLLGGAGGGGGGEGTAGHFGGGGGSGGGILAVAAWNLVCSASPNFVAQGGFGGNGFNDGGGHSGGGGGGGQGGTVLLVYHTVTGTPTATVTGGNGGASGSGGVVGTAGGVGSLITLVT